MVGLLGHMGVQGLKIDGSPGFAIFLGTDDHILWHHVTGSPMGTGSMTPNLTSLSRPAFTSSCQCNGSGMGECKAVGVAFGSTINHIGSPSIIGSGWCSQTLKVLEL